MHSPNRVIEQKIRIVYKQDYDGLRPPRYVAKKFASEYPNNDYQREWKIAMKLNENHHVGIGWCFGKWRKKRSKGDEYHGSFYNKACLIYENGRTLKHELSTWKNSGEFWDELAIMTFIHKLIYTVDHMHELSITHQGLDDLNNIFIIGNGRFNEPKLTNFTHSIMIDDTIEGIIY